MQLAGGVLAALRMTNGATDFDVGKKAAHFAYSYGYTAGRALRRMRLVNHARTFPRIAACSTLSALSFFAYATLAASPANAQGAQATVTINATVIEIQCTPQQRLRIRACAPAQESYSLENGKMLIARKPAIGQSVDAFPPQFDVHVDASRQVMIRTLLY